MKCLCINVCVSAMGRSTYKANPNTMCFGTTVIFLFTLHVLLLYQLVYQVFAYRNIASDIYHASLVHLQTMQL